MLRIQSDQLDAQHDQLASLQKVNEKQLEVLGLQATDLRESLDERKRDAQERHRAQASRVFIWEERSTSDPRISPVQRATGTAANPIVIVHVKTPAISPSTTLNSTGAAAPQDGATQTRNRPVPPSCRTTGTTRFVTFPPAATCRFAEQCLDSQTPPGYDGSAAQTGT